jgi:hypothetical protein
MYRETCVRLELSAQHNVLVSPSCWAEVYKFAEAINLYNAASPNRYRGEGSPQGDVSPRGGGIHLGEVPAGRRLVHA